MFTLMLDKIFRQASAMEQGAGLLCDKGPGVQSQPVRMFLRVA